LIADRSPWLRTVPTRYFKRANIVEQKGGTTVYALHAKALNHDQERHFCSHCGTTLFWYLSDQEDLVGIAGGCFGEDSWEPAGSYAHSKKLPWVELPRSWHIEYE